MSNETSKETIENAKAQLRKGTLEFCILTIISRGEVYASDILKELKGADLIVVEGTLYPLLSRLRANELVTYTWEESRSGPPRKYYRLTKRGEEVLKELETAWKNLTRSIESLNQ